MTSYTLRGLRILVVEDEYMIAADLAFSLEQAGATVVGPAPSVQAALTLLDNENVDGAVRDMNLLGETVFPVADVLHERQTPFVFISGYDMEGVPDVHSQVVHLAKPYDQATLIEILAKHLSA